MPALKSKQPVKVEIELSTEDENNESVREGAETEDMDGAKVHSRKRSVNGAKHTKAPMDGGMYAKKPMDAECGCGGKGRKGKASCDGTCGGYAKKMDALTPQEYLAACELGIQGRSRSYIRSRLDAAMNRTTSTVRADLKCGRGAISPGEKCTKGAPQQVAAKPARPRKRRSRLKGGAKVRGLRTAAKVAGVAALLGGAAYMQQTARRNMLQRGATAKPGTPSNTAFLNEIRSLGGNNQTAARARRRQREVNFMNQAAESYMKKRRDSVYADGFSPDLAQLAV